MLHFQFNPCRTDNALAIADKSQLHSSRGSIRFAASGHARSLLLWQGQNMILKVSGFLPPPEPDSKNPDGASTPPPGALLILNSPEIVHAPATSNLQAVRLREAPQKSSNRIVPVSELHVPSCQADCVVGSRVHQKRDFIAIFIRRQDADCICSEFVPNLRILIQNADDLLNHVHLGGMRCRLDHSSSLIFRSSQRQAWNVSDQRNLHTFQVRQPCPHKFTSVELNCSGLNLEVPWRRNFLIGDCGLAWVSPLGRW